MGSVAVPSQKYIGHTACGEAVSVIIHRAVPLSVEACERVQHQRPSTNLRTPATHYMAIALTTPITTPIKALCAVSKRADVGLGGRYVCYACYTAALRYGRPWDKGGSPRPPLFLPTRYTAHK
eukprot:COSAG05_NODE_2964_length_2459_cov_2.441525_1_plen_123_part_00